jgi:hypothetical protein
MPNSEVIPSPGHRFSDSKQGMGEIYPITIIADHESALLGGSLNNLTSFEGPRNFPATTPKIILNPPSNFMWQLLQTHALFHHLLSASPVFAPATSDLSNFQQFQATFQQFRG